MTKVLVIDDEAPIRLLCRVNLEGAGLHVVEAADGVEGLEKVREQRPNVILLDVMMPRRDGLSVAQELRDDARTKEIPIVFLSARGEFCDCVNELDLSDVVCLAEPFNPLELASFVTDFLQAAKARDPSPVDDLQDLWSLRAIATTPNDRPVDADVARWRSRRTSAGDGRDRSNKAPPTGRL